MTENNKVSSMTNDLKQELIAIVDEENLILDEDVRTLLSHDVFYRPDVIADSVVTPTSTQELADVVSVLQKAGINMHVRGGGMSYTDAYTPLKSSSVLIDMRQMSRIIEINEDDMYVTVETGCTWADLNTELEARNLRTPFWGPLSRSGINYWRGVVTKQRLLRWQYLGNNE